MPTKFAQKGIQKMMQSTHWIEIFSLQIHLLSIKCTHHTKMENCAYHKQLPQIEYRHKCKYTDKLWPKTHTDTQQMQIKEIFLLQRQVAKNAITKQKAKHRNKIANLEFDLLKNSCYLTKYEDTHTWLTQPLHMALSARPFHQLPCHLAVLSWLEIFL